MHRSLGYAIRQKRRERNLTQAELGGETFSKSYVSAVENGKIVPSTEALKQFAMYLGEAENYFLALAAQIERAVPLTVQRERTTVPAEEMVSTLTNEKAALLDILLEQGGYSEWRVPETFFTLSSESLAQLPQTRQAHYIFLQGLMWQKKGRYAQAVQAFEAALARENHQEHIAAILDALGVCYLQLHLPQVALAYALRAQESLQRKDSLPVPSTLQFHTALHCGEIYLLLGKYSRALECFEQARASLKPQQDMQGIGQLYWGLGYSTYALAYDQAYTGSAPIEQIEDRYQHASGYILQSLNLAQMGGNTPEMLHRRLALARIQVDWSTWRRRRLIRKEDSPSNAVLLAKLSSLLDDAYEQCRQVLMHWNGGWAGQDAALPAQDSLVISALALITRVATERSYLASLSGYENVLQRERSFAAALCQHVFDTYQEEEQLKELAWNVGNVSTPFPPSAFVPLPSISELPPPREGEDQWNELVGQVEVYCAAAKVAGMLGQTSNALDFRQECYTYADRLFLQALERLKQGQDGQQQDVGYVTRTYQRYSSFLEERLIKEMEQQQDTTPIARALLALCKRQFFTT